MRDSTDSSWGSQHPQLPPGFRFHPTDEELVVHYLKRKAASAPLPVAIIAEVDLYKFDPWELPSKAAFGEQEWYFFSPRDRKYPNGARPNRAATSGYWKATGTDKPILTSDGSRKVGVKKALVFYGGKPPKGVKTNWIMHEYRLADNNNNNNNNSPNSSTFKPPPPDPPHANKKSLSLRLDDWVLCRIYKKNNSSGSLPRPALMEHDDKELSMMSMAKPRNNGYGLGLENDLFEGILGADQGMQNGSDLVSSNSKGINATNNFSIKRALTSQFWNEAGSSTKRFHGDLNTGGTPTIPDDQNANSFVSLLTQNAAFHPNAILGEPVLRQQFHLPGINWN